MIHRRRSLCPRCSGSKIRGRIMECLAQQHKGAGSPGSGVDQVLPLNDPGDPAGLIFPCVRWEAGFACRSLRSIAFRRIDMKVPLL